jgi:hypothetical protein
VLLLVPTGQACERHPSHGNYFRLAEAPALFYQSELERCLVIGWAGRVGKEKIMVKARWCHAGFKHRQGGRVFGETSPALCQYLLLTPDRTDTQLHVAASLQPAEVCDGERKM